MQIPNFPASLLHEHHAWHTGGRNPAALNPGAGDDFLTFHHNFVAKALAWYKTQPGFSPLQVTPWTAVPPQLKLSVLGWSPGLQNDETRLSSNPLSFPSSDELGRFIEFGEFGGNNIHGWLHNAAANHFSEPLLATFDSPQSTYFYQLHGLVDHWWQSWTAAHPKWEPFHSAGDRLRNLAVGQNADGRLEVFGTASDDSIWHTWQTAANDGWSGWSVFHSSSDRLRSLVVGRNADGRLEVFGTASDDSIWHTWQTAPNNGWSSWVAFHSGSDRLRNLAVGQNADGRLEIFGTASDDSIWHTWQTAANNGWNS
jgi:hypothetical protein